ncbi:RING-H2 finger ATL70 -like protein [Gossypium arboreum]|uniref:RING-H2 finger ATL70-like protein n=2 Tax=Gossypium TaxID=3633 RepID=A0A0B0MTR4_GOSAR|nr:RING-H2 finger protein ATL70-like [Gossypium arboreum]KAG4177567.1 hypothetical protein ERO13_A11G315600v2 [Gossypium hirsutum]KHG02296.1 RING-H2 finger ATL70 -like protein [Gossypium arboreum]TYI03933.1 hypothetical protein ES332_A11G377700v1 [Gossypium tomentosum]
MSASLDSDSGFVDSKEVTRFGYAIGVSAIILLIMIVIALASYVCGKALQSPQAPPFSSDMIDPESFFVDDGGGLDEETIKSYPKLMYSEAKLLKCVDHWLRLQSTCPVCRTSPIPTPLSMPPADDHVAPLPSRPGD